MIQSNLIQILCISIVNTININTIYIYFLITLNKNTRKNYDRIKNMKDKLLFKKFKYKTR